MIQTRKMQGRMEVKNVRKMTISWLAMLVGCLLLVFGFMVALLINNSEAKQAEDRRAELQYALTKTELDTLDLRKAIKEVGTNSYVEATARSLNFVKPGELHFEVTNSDQLVNYTPEELQILADEMAQPDR